MMKTFYRGFTIKTTLMRGQYRGFTLWLIYTRTLGNKPVFKGITKDYKGPHREAEKTIEALLSGCRVFTKAKQSERRSLQLTEHQINLILTDEIFHEICS